jgi:1-acyl-sn-glycerol-3-phosphate acyltransferase
MIIKAKPVSPFFINPVAIILLFIFRRRFNKGVINEADIKPGHSYILMCNHFSFLDGFLLAYLAQKVLWKKGYMNRVYIMSLKKQMQKNKWLQYMGSFSVEPGKRSITESFDYAAEVLEQPGNLLLFFPQGKLESSHVRYIKMEYGIKEIAHRIKGDCQLLWCSTTLEYFESTKPTVYFDMLDCGTAKDFDMDEFQKKVNDFHRASISKHMRYTDEHIKYH